MNNIKYKLNKMLFSLIAIPVGVSILIFLLFHFTKMPNEQPNGFNRTWIKDSLLSIAQIPTKYPYEKLSGATNSHFFISVPNPQWLFMMNWNLNDNKYFYSPVKVNERMIAHNVLVDSPNIFIAANNIPALFYGKLLSKKIDTLRIAASTFTRSELMTPNCLVIRGFDTSYKKQSLKKISIRSGKTINQSDIIEGKNNLGFAEDGMLAFDSTSNNLVYVEFYKNTIFCFDTSLNLKYRGKTIDTTNTNTLLLEDANVKGTDYLIPSKARTLVNSNCCTYKGKLFIISGLIADNENRKSFRNNSVVDIYELDNGKYIGSFYIPHTNGQKVKSFLINNNILVVLYNNYLRTFDMNRLVFH